MLQILQKIMSYGAFHHYLIHLDLKSMNMVTRLSFDIVTFVEIVSADILYLFVMCTKRPTR